MSEFERIYTCVVGSRAYGLAGPASDVDLRGVFVVPTRLFWELDKPPTHLDGPREEEFSWEVERLCELALQANPTVLECLWSPLVEHITATGEELLAVRTAFLSRRVAQSYGNYARDQLKKLDNTLGRTGQIKWKQAMHMVRLLMAGVGVLSTHEVLVDVGEHRETLLAIKHGERSWEDVSALAATWEQRLAEAESTTRLPEEPDRPTINDFLIRTRRDHL
ncbi:nucleotidyltransferase domain-containing protein [Catelliglobosispora koreensis]|uniref:nucleotidyltransferase domain-containing protein n=1 Tax=Catelliglobosispora koreensis TaxID=129052 RepID=UPI000382EB3F|nr:nucleotidyltransferase domain-containing protein [Catelliglobosispora koreensis]